MEENKVTNKQENTSNKGLTILQCPRDAYVSLQNIDKVYENGVQAVFNFNLDIKKHEFIVFVGPSGCGKSTTLRMIAGLENITGGNLFIDGEYVNDVSPKDRNIAMVFQSYALYPHMSVFDNMAFSLKINKAFYKVYTPESQEKINAVEEKLNVLYGQFSKINSKYDKLTRIKTEKENAERDFATIQDKKKAAKFQIKIKKLEPKLVEYASICKEMENYNIKIDALSKELNNVKNGAQFVYAIDAKNVKKLEKLLAESEKEGRDQTYLDTVREQLK